MYQTLSRILFLLSPEKAHHLSMNFFHAACANPVLKKMLTRRFQPHNKAVNVFGISFKNLVGLGAGFDKNAKYLRELEVMGFGFVEIGTVTPKPQSGNEQPRLFSLAQRRSADQPYGIQQRWGGSDYGSVEIMVAGKPFKERPHDHWWQHWQEQSDAK